MTETIDYSEERVTTLVKDLCADLVEHPPLEGCMQLEDYLDTWQYARLWTKHEHLALLTFAEMLNRTNEPMHSFTVAMLNWMDDARAVIREEADAELPDTLDTSRNVH
jgi:hypothetical protein